LPNTVNTASLHSASNAKKIAFGWGSLHDAPPDLLSTYTLLALD